MYESKVILPDDIQRIVRNFVLKRVIPFVSIEIIVISYILLLGEESFKIVDRTPRILIYLALVILPFFIFGMPKLIDRSWSGEIVKINVEAGYESSGRHLFNANYLILTIKRDDGKIIDCTVNSFNTGSWIPTSASSDFAHGKAEYVEDDYFVGDKVYHYYGVPHLLVIHRNNSRDCVVCGANNPDKNDRCFSCGHSIIKKTF